MDKLMKNIQIIAFSILLIGIIFLTTNAFIANKKNAVFEKRIDHIDEEIDEINAGIKRILNKSSFQPSQQNYAKNPMVEISELEYDFGKIKKSAGMVNKKFTLSNAGQGKLLIGDISTSCGCTLAIADKKEAGPGEKIIIEIKFDPNFHEEPKGRFSRSVFIPTNDPNNQEIELKIFVEIVK